MWGEGGILPRYAKLQWLSSAPCRASLDVAAAAAAAALALGAVGLGRQRLVERVEAGVGRQAVTARGHSLVNAVQALSLREARDLVLRREALDGCIVAVGEERQRERKRERKRERELS